MIEITAEIRALIDKADAADRHRKSTSEVI